MTAVHCRFTTITRFSKAAKRSPFGVIAFLGLKAPRRSVAFLVADEEGAQSYDDSIRAN